MAMRPVRLPNGQPNTKHMHQPPFSCLFIRGLAEVRVECLFVRGVRTGIALGVVVPRQLLCFKFFSSPQPFLGLGHLPSISRRVAVITNCGR